MIRVYDRVMRSGDLREYYDNSGYFNFGYWGGQAKSQREACDALVDQLVARIAAREGRIEGRILDVACGLGASTLRLERTYPPEKITAINISEAQILDARARAPRCDFRVMSATALDFPDGHFDAVMCVEAAFHFDTRDTFLREAFRVLKPGGSLVLSDILFRDFVRRFAEAVHVPRANLVTSIDAYRSRIDRGGLCRCRRRRRNGGVPRRILRASAPPRRRGAPCRPHEALAKPRRRLGFEDDCGLFWLGLQELSLGFGAQAVLTRDGRDA